MIFGLLVQKLGSFIKTKLYVSRGDFGRKKVFGIKSFFSIIWSLWADGFQDSVEKCRKCHQSCILRVGRNIVPKHCFGEQKFITFGISAKQNSWFWWKIVDLVVKPSFYVSKRTFWGKKNRRKNYFNSFFDFGRESFRLLSENSQQSCQISILRIQRRNPGK